MYHMVQSMTPNCHTLKKTSKKCDNLGSFNQKVLFWTIIKQKRKKVSRFGVLDCRNIFLEICQDIFFLYLFFLGYGIYVILTYNPLDRPIDQNRLERLRDLYPVQTIRERIRFNNFYYMFNYFYTWTIVRIFLNFTFGIVQCSMGAPVGTKTDGGQTFKMTNTYV